MAMLEVRDLEVYYGVIQALKGISFDVNQGEIVALIGANGAGKTTTLHTVTGLFERPFRTYHVRRNRYHKESPLQARQHGNRPCSGGTPCILHPHRSPESEARCLHKKR